MLLLTRKKETESSALLEIAIINYDKTVLGAWNGAKK